MVSDKLEKRPKKTSMNSARHIKSIDFFDVKIIDSEKDSLRFYYLGKKYENTSAAGRRICPRNR